MLTISAKRRSCTSADKVAGWRARFCTNSTATTSSRLADEKKSLAGGSLARRSAWSLGKGR
ncbi:hypothetical protein D3C80_1975020 [compost metagenome]